MHRSDRRNQQSQALARNSCTCAFVAELLHPPIRCGHMLAVISSCGQGCSFHLTPSAHTHSSSQPAHLMHRAGGGRTAHLGFSVARRRRRSQGCRCTLLGLSEMPAPFRGVTPPLELAGSSTRRRLAPRLASGARSGLCCGTMGRQIGTGEGAEWSAGAGGWSWGRGRGGIAARAYCVVPGMEARCGAARR